HIFADAEAKRVHLGTYDKVRGGAPGIAAPGQAAEVAEAGLAPAVPDRGARIRGNAEPATLMGKVESIEERVKAGEKQVKLDNNGLQFQSADKNFKFRLGGRIHTDYTHSSDDHFLRGGDPVQANDGAELRRGRLEFSGTLF